MSTTGDTNSEKGNQALGEYIKRLRMKRGLGLREAGRRGGVDPTWWSRLEEGRYVSPHVHMLSKVAHALSVDIEELWVAAGLATGRRLPSLSPYLRAKYDLPPEAVAQLEAHFELLSDKYQPKGDDDGRNHLNAT